MMRPPFLWSHPSVRTEPSLRTSVCPEQGLKGHVSLASSRPKSEACLDCGERRGTKIRREGQALVGCRVTKLNNPRGQWALLLVFALGSFIATSFIILVS